MDGTFLQKIVEGSPLIVGLLVIAVVTIWRKWMEERDKHVAALTTGIELANKVLAGFEDLKNHVKQKDQ